jgi:NADH-quinone oxidoreductase subunit M
VMKQHPPVDLTWSERIPALILFVVLLYIGFWPRSVSESANEALAAPAARTASTAVTR